MEFSDYLLKVPHTANNILLVGLRKRVVIEVGNEMFRKVELFINQENEELTTSEKTLLKKLIECELVLENKENELEVIARRSMISRVISDTFAAIIVPTIGCNLRCSYCFQSHMAHANGLPSSQVDNIVKFIERKLLDKNFNNLHVRWFGGEPLLAMPTIKDVSNKLIKLCRECGYNYSSDMVTNGTYLDRSLAEELLDYGITDVQITFDGGKEEHNKKRRGPKDTDTYEKIIENLSDIIKHLRVTIRIHVAPYNINGIYNLLDDLFSQGYSEKIHRIYFAPLFNYRQSKKDIAFFPNEKLFMSSQQFAREQVKLHKRAFELKFNLGDPLDIDYGVCSALRENTVVIDHNGELSKCYMDVGDKSETFGDILGNIHKPANLDKWKEAAFHMDEECSHCTFAPICLGGCTKQRESFGDKSAICTPLKYNYESLIPIHFAPTLKK